MTWRDVAALFFLFVAGLMIDVTRLGADAMIDESLLFLPSAESNCNVVHEGLLCDGRKSRARIRILAVEW